MLTVMRKKTSISFIAERHDIFGEKYKAQVLRTKTSGNVYQLRMWIEKEQRYIRKSLKTKDLEIAIQKAEKQVLDTLGIISSGKNVFSITIEKLITLFLEQKNKDVKNNLITHRRYIVIRSHLKHFASFINKNKLISSLDSQSCYDYAEWRKKKDNCVKTITIRNEQTTINSLAKYAHKKKYTDFDGFEFRKIGKNKGETGRRDTFSEEEYSAIIDFLRSWQAKKNNKNEEDRKEKSMIRELYFIASNTLLRVGELLQLKWEDIEAYEKAKDDIGHSITLVRIRVRAETSKVRKERLITVRGGDYFKRLYSKSSFRNKNDYVFHGSSGDKQLCRKKLYNNWNEIMKGVGIDYKKRNITWYSCRHFGITCRLKAGASVYDIAQIAGTSVAQIEAHYGHFNQSMSRAASLLNYRYSKEGISVLE